MTKVESEVEKRCYQCDFYKREVNDDIGVCLHVESDHYSHVLGFTHPACENFEKEK